MLSGWCPRRRSAAVWVMAAAVLIAVGVSPLSVPAEPPPNDGSVQVISGGGAGGNVVGITVGDPGSLGSNGTGGSTRSGAGGNGSASCDAQCQQAWETHNGVCTLATAGAQQPSIYFAGFSAAQLSTFLNALGCTAAQTAGALPPPPPTAAQLAQLAYGQLRLAAPAPARYPSGTLRDGRPYTIVHTEMWFSTSAASWQPESKTVCVGALCATATARPTSLSFDPGNGDAAVWCPGPGTAFVRPAGGSWVPGPQPQGCDYLYRDSTFGFPNGELTATYTITWTVAWTGTNGTAGTLYPLTTATGSTFAVAELQSVVAQ